MSKKYKALITTGPTIERIDPVRYISNFSSGKQGFAIANALVAQGFEVTVVSGPTNLATPNNMIVHRVESAQDMLKACKLALPVDVAICTAAVCDWRPRFIEENKMKKQSDVNQIQLELTKNPDILREIANDEYMRPKYVIGFAAETENLFENATKKLVDKNCNMIVANDVRRSEYSFGGDQNKVHIITKSKTDSWEEMSKDDVGKKLAIIVKEVLDKF